MWWGGCEFWGSESVQRGKYPGFREDSEERFVRLGSLSCRTPVIKPKWNRKNVWRNRSADCRGLRVAARQEGKFRPSRRSQDDRQAGEARKPAWLLSESRLRPRIPPRALLAWGRWGRGSLRLLSRTLAGLDALIPRPRQRQRILGLQKRH